MSKKTEKAFNELLGELVSSVRGVKNLVNDQVPEIVQQLVKYKSAISIYNIIISVFVGSLIALATFIIKMHFPEETPGGGTFFALLVYALDIVITTCCVLGEISELIQLKTAPKLFILEYLKDMVTTKRED